MEATKYVVEVKAFDHHVVRIVEAKDAEAAKTQVLASLNFSVKVTEQVAT